MCVCLSVCMYEYVPVSFMFFVVEIFDCLIIEQRIHGLGTSFVLDPDHVASVCVCVCVCVCV